MSVIDKVFAGFTKLFGSKSERDLKKIKPILDQIKSYEPALSALSDDQLKQKTLEFKDRIKQATVEIDKDISEIKKKLSTSDETLSVDERKALVDELDALDKEYLETVEAVLLEMMPEAFAVLKETCKRFVGQTWMVAGNEMTWNMIPYDVQLIGGIVLHQGKIAEMKTGEGKTLVAIFPTYLNALVGRGVHVITVNPYLAQRDAEWNAPIFGFHGLTVDCIDKYEPNGDKRRQAYRADITYGTNNEFGFDYLRDNMVVNADELVQRGHHYSIVDEVDSVLIDEARTPLIISGPIPQDSQTQIYSLLKPRVANLVEAQKKLVAHLIMEGEELLKNGQEDKAGLAFLRAQRGFPKNKKFQKLMQEPQFQKLVQKTEYYYLQDNAKNMPVVDEELYYSVDYKLNSIEMTEKGREFITGKDEDPNFFVIPDVGTETAILEQKIKVQEETELAEIQHNSEYSDSYKEELIERKKKDLVQERSNQLSGIHRLFSERSERIHAVNQLLKAYTLFERDDEYIVQDGKVQIVDEHTGRVLSGRRYSDGLHQAIEAKENVRVEAATQTYATITLQNYFRMYHKLAGMTGTAITEESEFFEIYKLEVVEIPTNKPISRKDAEDKVYRTKREKFNAVIDFIKEKHEKGQPILVGTTSVEVSEMLSRMLQRTGIPHNVLNAKQHARESEIVKAAGQTGAVTIATNMAGRGTDIKLGSGIEEVGGLAIIGTERHESRRIDLQLRGRSGRQGDNGESQFYVSLEDDLMRLFGGSDRIMNLMDRMKFEEGEVIQHPWITKSLERAQKRVEQNNFSIRKRQLEYDDVLNNQRNVIYDRRRHALIGERLTSDIFEMMEDVIAGIVEQYYAAGDYEGLKDTFLRVFALNLDVEPEVWSKWGLDATIDYIIEKALEMYRAKEKALAGPIYEVMKNIPAPQEGEQRPSAVQVVFSDGFRYLRVVADVARIIETEGREIMRALERTAVLSVIDDKWMEHLRELDSLKEGINLRAYAQKDPLIEYKREAFNMFRTLLESINSETISLIWKAFPADQGNGQRRPQPQQQVQAPKPKVDLSRAKTQHDSATNMGLQMNAARNQETAMSQAAHQGEKHEPVVVGDKVGRNDPCPCGSGKKYKQCHGKTA
ncbi:preprotein translocase subunit SecA [bacterium]|nr:MAG: preprotein translocase subunit SecA [bacterium]